MTFRNSPSGPFTSSVIAGPNLGSDLSGHLLPLARPRRFFEWDYFWTGRGTLVQSQIGRMGWSLNGPGAPTFQRLPSNLSSSAKLRIITGATTNNRASFTLGSSEAMHVAWTEQIFIHQAVFDMNGSLADKTFLFGGVQSMATDPTVTATGSIAIAYNPTISPNFLPVYRLGNAEVFLTPSRIVPVPANDPVLLTIYQPTPFHFEFYVSERHGSTFESVLIGAYNANSSPASVRAYSIGFRLQTLVNASASVNLGYWGMTSRPIDAVYSSDNFVDSMTIRA